jgi:uncharacterized damage-inducible protein DinB
MVDRVEPAFAAGERDMLDGWLDFHRATLAMKCEGLTDEQLRERAVPPSNLSLLGLVRHMAEVERGWFRQVLCAEEIGDIYQTDDDDDDADFNGVADGDVAEAFASWRAECDLSRQAARACPSLDMLARKATRMGNVMSLRWIMMHMIEEYARHNGHADLIRERIDGSVGD